jgi:hypothetical protein
MSIVKDAHHGWQATQATQGPESGGVVGGVAETAELCFLTSAHASRRRRKSLITSSSTLPDWRIGASRIRVRARS